jgi:inner membrane protein
MEHISTETAIVSLLVAIIGGITPDLDKPGSKIWGDVPGGGCLSRIINPVFIGGHRHITHSFIGMVLFGGLMRLILNALPLGDTIDTNIVFWSFIIAFASHLVTDMLTKEGVPLLFPLPLHLGFPPFEALRLRTNGWVENLLVTPAIICGVIALGYYRSDNALLLLKALGFH